MATSILTQPVPRDITERFFRGETVTFTVLRQAGPFVLWKSTTEDRTLDDGFVVYGRDYFHIFSSGALIAHIFRPNHANAHFETVAARAGAGSEK